MRRARGLMGREEGKIAILPMRSRARLNLIANLLSSQKTHSDWVRVCFLLRNFLIERRSETSRYHGSMDLFLDDNKTNDDGDATARRKGKK